VAQPTGSNPIPAHVFADPSIVDRITTGVDVATDNTLRALVYPTTSTSSVRHRTIEVFKSTRWQRFHECHHSNTKAVETGIMAAESSANGSHSIDDAEATVTQGPDPTTLANESFAPVVKAAPPADSRLSAD
jgi:hypothetical protein